MDVLAGAILVLLGAVFVVVAALGLPGIWLMGLAAAGVELWRPEILSVWAIVTVIGLALLAEIAELVAGAVGAKKAGGSRRASIGALVGAIVGGIAGTILIPIPVVGTVAGSALGAGIAAASLEATVRHQEEEGAIPRRRGQALRVGSGAMVGRLVASALKGVLAAVALGVIVASVVLAGF